MNDATDLARAGWRIEHERIKVAAAESARTGKKVVECLEELCGLDVSAFTRELARFLHQHAMAMPELRTCEAAFDVLPLTEALRHDCVLVRDQAATLYMIYSDPFNQQLIPWARERIDLPFSMRLVHHRDLSAYMALQEASLKAMDSLLDQRKRPALDDQPVEDLSLKSIVEDSNPIIKLVNSTIYDALASQASDVHLESTANGMVIRSRIDGVLSTVGSVDQSEIAEQVVSRIKVMSELDIAERRVPQDGRFRISAKGRVIDFRVSIMPSIHGEDVVLRVLDKQHLSDHASGLTLARLGFEGACLDVLRRLSREPHGMLLVTGPTGSGKTTTLYAALAEINHGHDKIITIEDPVEYQLPGVLQIPVNERKGLTFARGLRSILRHDPDKLLVGEIRDPETAQIAVQAALTGHLVFTTLHANNVYDVISRFLHMQVDPYSFVSALNGVIAQRLIRRLCTNCVAAVRPAAEELAASAISADALAGIDFRSGRGCGQCRGSGYRGRKAISEYLVLSDEIREMIVAREPIRRIKQIAREQGTRLLREAAWDAVRSGETDLKEINRVTGVS